MAAKIRVNMSMERLVSLPVADDVPRSRNQGIQAGRSRRGSKRGWNLCFESGRGGGTPPSDFKFGEASERENLSGVPRAARLTSSGTKIYVFRRYGKSSSPWIPRAQNTYCSTQTMKIPLAAGGNFKAMSNLAVEDSQFQTSAKSFQACY